MKKLSKYLRDTAITIVLLLLAFAVSLLCQKLDVEEHTTTVFVFAVFLILSRYSLTFGKPLR